MRVWKLCSVTDQIVPIIGGWGVGGGGGGLLERRSLLQ